MKSFHLLLLAASSVAAQSGQATTTTGGNGFYTAAGSAALFGSGTWCGSGCGKCYNLTSTGNAPSGQGTGGDSGASIVVMVTNLCPYAGNEAWCPNSGASNEYGYQYHFDIMAQSPVIGDNPIVNFAEVSCPSAASSDFAQCQCAS
ncbi:family 45 glycoside hydrolase [Cryphonectria parasitica EP155]|uniref:Family 45 glycoside hydrolase n=1 Tax=Cryphonectria parasitica (strain ATCC 38755 / EP155) TaxID=660469 RepID=A0A9P4Y995_CRYP1|nr:family 45 glycoside hydrolase [Cryphonectria parasitica EP155]KAF3768848.1 family 45 glycoside hydrolase [Cryphonectria parasitica EP155]